MAVICNTHVVIGGCGAALFLVVRAPIRSVNNTTLFTLLVDDSSIAFDDETAIGAECGIERLVACWMIALDGPIFCFQCELIL